ncbi:MAG: DMT family transporter [Candidatus Limnocylindria bacterium]
MVAVVWGLCFVLIQASLPSQAPLLLAALRAVIGGGVLLVWVAVRRSHPGLGHRHADQCNADPTRPGLPSWPLLMALALANAAIAFGAMYLAAGRAEAAVASILAGGQPLVLAGAGWALFGERLSGRALVGLAVAMSGVVLIATTNSGATSLDGVALALLAAAAPAAGTVLMHKLLPTIDIVLTTSVQFLIGGAMLAGVSALVEPWSELTWSSAAVLGMLFLGIVGTGLAYIAWFWLLDRLSLARLGAALFLVPVTGVGVAIMAGDRPTPMAIAGIAALIAGIGIVSLGASSEPSDGASPRTT